VQLYLKDCLQLVRPAYLLFFSLGLLTGYLGGFDSPICKWKLLEAFLAFFCLWTSSYLINDLNDIEVDRANGLDRPLCTGRAQPSQYRWGFLAFSFAGVLLLLLLPPLSRLSLLLCWTLGVLYSMPPIALKQLPGVALLPPAGAFVLLVVAGAGLRGAVSQTDGFVSATMFFLIVSAGNSKDLGDARGDRIGARRTFSSLIGARSVVLISLLATVVVASLVLLSYFVLPLGPLSLPLFLFGISFLFAGSVAFVTDQHYTPESVRRRNRLQSFGASLILLGYITGALS